MAVQNLIQGELVNGSIGQVIGFGSSEDESPTEIDEIKDKKNPSTGISQRPVQDATIPTLWPLVLFLNGKKKLCIPVEFTVNNAQGQAEASRHQVAVEQLHFQIISKPKFTQDPPHPSVGSQCAQVTGPDIGKG